MGDIDNNDLMEAVHPKLRPYVKALLKHEFGLLGKTASLENVDSGSIVAKDDYKADRFYFKIHFCKKDLYWQVLMNGNDLFCPPDFVTDESFLCTADAQFMKTKVPSLANWCPTNVKCLLNVILEMLEVYKEWQLAIFDRNQAFQRYSFEYQTLMSMLQIPPADVEVCLQYNNNRGISIFFVIRLNVDFSSLPAILPDSRNLAILVIEFKDNARNQIQIYKRHELEETLGGPIEIPDLPPDMSLIDYVPMMQDSLQKKVDQITYGVSQRQILYSYLIQYFEPALLNADTLMYQRVSFLLESNGFHCVLKVDIPLDFPTERPKLTLLSLKKSRTGMPRSEEYNNYNYNKNWPGRQIAEKIFTFVKNQAIGKFKDSITLFSF